MNCKHCGKKIAKTSKFCSSCGAKIEDIVEIEEKKDIKNSEETSNNESKASPININTTGVLTSAIIATVLSLFVLNFLALIFGIIAIVYLCTYKSSTTDELRVKQVKNGKIFNIVTWATFGVGIIIRIVIIFLIIIPFLIVGTKYGLDYEDRDWDYYEEYYDDEENYYDDYTYEYDNLIEIDYNSLIRLYKSSTNTVIVIGKNNCMYCDMYKPIIDDIAYYNDIDIYYLDINNMTDKEYNSMINTIDYFKENEMWGTPTTLIVRNSKTVGYLSGYKDSKSTLNFFKRYSIIE